MPCRLPPDRARVEAGREGEFRCPLCQRLLEVFDGSTDIAYRLTVAPEKLFE